VFSESTNQCVYGAVLLLCWLSLWTVGEHTLCAIAIATTTTLFFVVSTSRVAMALIIVLLLFSSRRRSSKPTVIVVEKKKNKRCSSRAFLSSKVSLS